MKQNPFTPSFGSVPLLFAGRQTIIADVLAGLDNGPGDPNRATLLIGPRGSGKTALLTAIANQAAERGWIAANVTAGDGMLEDIVERTLDSAAEYLARPVRGRLTAVQIAGFGLTREAVSPVVGNWRTRMNTMLDELARHDVGLLITVDEVDDQTPELGQLVDVFQHFVRERRQVALLMAGLPHNVSVLLQNKKISFYRRAFQRHLGLIDSYEVRETLRQTVELSGRTIDPGALDMATGAAGGFPFLIQLVGYHVWRQHPDAPTITIADAQEGVTYAQADMETMIFAATIRELSDTDRDFLNAMLPDPDVSRMSDIAERMGVTTNYANQYRARLIEQGIVGTRGRGKLGFDMPMLRDYLIRHQESESDNGD